MKHFDCIPYGAANLNTSYVASVQNASGKIWWGYLDGQALQPHSFSPGEIDEWGEHTGTSSCSGWNGSAFFGQSATWPWQRFRKSDLTWITVQSSYTYNWSGCWSFSGGPPGWFAIIK